MNNLCCWLVTCRPGNSVLVTVVEKPIWPAHAAARRRREIAYVAGRTKPTAGLAQLSASPTGHPPMSPTGHQSCRGTWPPGSREVNGSEASHQPDKPEIALGKTPPPEPPPPEVEVRSACHSALRPAPMFIGCPGATNATPTLGHRERRRIDGGRATIRSLHPGMPGAGNCGCRNVCAP